jgi:hypothetical protein
MHLKKWEVGNHLMQVREVAKQNFGANNKNSFSSETIKHSSERRWQDHRLGTSRRESNRSIFSLPSMSVFKTRIPVNVLWDND